MGLIAVPVLGVAVTSALAGAPPGGVGGAVLGLAAVGVVLAMPVGIGVGLGRWEVAATGIRGPDSWLVPRTVAWDDIRSVSAWPIPGYWYVWVNTARRRWVLW